MSDKPKKARKRGTSKNELPPELDDFMREMAKGAAGKPLSESMGAGSPLTNLIGRFVELAYEAEIDEHLGYAAHERLKSQDGQPVRRENTRNGSHSKQLRTSHGEVEVKVPRDRKGEFEPQIVGKHRSITQELEDRIISMYVGGMTTRDIEAHVEELYGIEASPMLVSRVVERLEPEIKAWRNRPLEAIYPVVFIDAIHFKVRHSHGVRSTAAYLVCGYNEGGRLEILGASMATKSEVTAESASYWHQVLLELKNRGVEDILILCADGLSGLEDAARAVFPHIRFQPCVVHLVRASLRHITWKDRKLCTPQMRAIYQAPTYEAAEMALEAFEKDWGHRYPAVMAQWHQNLPRLSDMWSYGAALRRVVYTTNMIENINRQVRKVTKNRGAFPNTDSALRLLCLVLMRIDEKYRQKNTRKEWKEILCELHILFGDRLPDQWGYRYQIAYSN